MDFVIINVWLNIPLISLYPNEDSKEFHHYPFVVKLNRCVWNYNTLNDICNKIYVPNKTEDSNLSLFNIWIERINKAFIIQCKCRFDGRNVTQINDGIMINVNVIVKSIMYAKKIMFGILLYVIVKMDNI